ncbi:hypothetical protein ACFY5A_00715 [Microbacterium sp. NPDC012755]|uniref:hypothetical protein n=1 Tax=Microbacterium sp. NPDC012755 TaxID=3364184 RepID=UPI00367473D5
MTAEPHTSAPENELRGMLRSALERELGALGAEASGVPVFGWRDRSLGAAVSRGGDALWLRLVWSRTEWARGSWWTGNQDAGAISGVRKPRVLEVREQTDGPLTVRAELMTLVPGHPAQSTPELRAAPSLDEAWWNALAGGLDALSVAPTARRAVDPDGIRRRIAVFFGLDVDTDVGDWRAAHGDLHWNNLHAEPFAMVDWEAWGLAPRGYDAAFLLCHSLAEPDIVAQITRRFADDLDSDDGVVSQLYVLTKLLTRADAGEHPHLVAPIHRHVDRLIGRATRTRPLPRGEGS